MKRLSAVLISVLTFATQISNAQFYSMGTEPASVRWREITTPDFRVVYPAGADSLAREYATALEVWKPRVSATLGYEPNQAYRRPMPVVMHSFSSLSNGSVSWAPRKMDLLPTPDFSAPMPLDWTNQLISHESRHVAQMQFPSEFKVLRALTAEIWSGAAFAVYGGQAFLEGDAVVAETELSASGRGRSASFLEYYRVCRAAGQTRDYWQWRWGSLGRYTPDHYALGYVTIAGRRSQTGSPYYSRDFLRDISDHGLLRFFNLQRSLGASKTKPFSAAFDEVCGEFGKAWDANDSLRFSRSAPMRSERVTDPGKRYEAYRGLVDAEGRLYAIRSGLDRATSIVEIQPSGAVRNVRSVNSTVDNLTYSPYYGSIYYAQYRSDSRWSLRSWSEIGYVDSLGYRGRSTIRTRLFNPAPSGGGDYLFAIEYTPAGRTELVSLGATNGTVYSRFAAPSGVQFSEVRECSGTIWLSAITDDGSAIYRLENDALSLALPSSRVTIKNLFIHDGLLHFTSDRDGTDQLYRLCPDGSVEQLTSARFGASDFAFVGEDLYYTSQSVRDRGVWKTPVSELPVRPIDWNEVWRDPIAEKLSAQAALAGAAIPASGAASAVPDTSSFSVRDYSKLSHLVRFHSWVPVYVDYDEIQSISSETLSSEAGLGATAFFHNDLNTFYGSVSASAWTLKEGFTPGVHARATFCGWYPVLEGSIDISGKSRQGSLRTYIPWSFSSNGWNRGIIPQAKIAVGDLAVGTAAIRGYITRAVSSSCIYPRWGIGAEAAVQGYIGANPKGVKPLVSTLFYGYVPGFVRTHGTFLSATLLTQGVNYQNTYSAIYAFPFADVNWSFLGPIAYIRNFEAKLKASYICTKKADIFGFGGSLAAVLGNLLWIPFDTRVGVGAMYYPGIEDPLSLGVVFSVDL